MTTSNDKVLLLPESVEWFFSSLNEFIIEQVVYFYCDTKKCGAVRFWLCRPKRAMIVMIPEKVPGSFTGKSQQRL